MGLDTASLQQVVLVLKTTTEDRRSKKLAALSAPIDDHFLCKAGTERVHQTLRVSMAVQNNAARDVSVAQ